MSPLYCRDVKKGIISPRNRLPPTASGSSVRPGMQPAHRRMGLGSLPSQTLGVHRYYGSTKTAKNPSQACSLLTSRYVGKMAGLYPADDLNALYCDKVLDDVKNKKKLRIRKEFRFARRSTPPKQTKVTEQ